MGSWITNRPISTLIPCLPSPWAVDVKVTWFEKPQLFSVASCNTGADALQYHCRCHAMQVSMPCDTGVNAFQCRHYCLVILVSMPHDTGVE